MGSDNVAVRVHMLDCSHACLSCLLQALLSSKFSCSVRVAACTGWVVTCVHALLLAAVATLTVDPAGSPAVVCTRLPLSASVLPGRQHAAQTGQTPVAGIYVCYIGVHASRDDGEAPSAKNNSQLL